jgi:hypothetical protein
LPQDFRSAGVLPLLLLGLGEAMQAKKRQGDCGVRRFQWVLDIRRIPTGMSLFEGGDDGILSRQWNRQRSDARRSVLLARTCLWDRAAWLGTMPPNESATNRRSVRFPKEKAHSRCRGLEGFLSHC